MFVAIVWGTTFVASKMALDGGLTPIGLMSLRFLLGYVALWVAYPQVHAIRLDKQELKFLLLGLCGGSVYFLAEYEALRHTSAVNVGIITSTVPLVSACLYAMLSRTLPRAKYFVGTAIALLGVVMVVTNGRAEMSYSMTGDVLACVATLLWAVYSVVLSSLGARVNPLLASRRLFFYALVSISPFAMCEGIDVSILTEPQVLWPTMYLGLVASGLCIWLWNVSTNNVGIMQTNNFLYLLTIVPVFASYLFMLSELTRWNVCGSLVVLVGIMVANKGVQKKCAYT